MATRYYCDRCGAETTHGPTSETRSVYLDELIPLYLPAVGLTNDAEQHERIDGVDLDLCRTCVGSILEFLGKTRVLR